MSSNMKSYFRRLAQGYEDGPSTAVVKPLLEVASQAYTVGNSIVKSCYDKKMIARKKFKFPVISVGNLTWGGTGKTPFVEYLARRVGERRKIPLVLTRGYSHDEVEQFRHHIPKAVIGVGKDRYKIGVEASTQRNVDIAILDDGLQHWPIERDLDIVMINALDPFGNGKVIPRGILREPMQALGRADMVVISHTNLITKEELNALKNKISDYAPKATLVDSYLEPLFFYRAKKKTRVSLNRLENQKVTTFSGVGTPRSFQMLLTRFNIKPTRNFEFTDHHNYSKKDLAEVQEISIAAGTEEIITTEKDFYRSPQMIADTLNPLILATRLRIASGEDVLSKKLFRLLGVGRR